MTCKFLDKIDTIATQSAAIERDERVTVFITELRDALGAAGDPPHLIGHIANGLDAVNFAALPIHHRARFKEALTVLRNLLAGNPKNTPDPVTPVAETLTRLFDMGIIDRP
ncbi:MAG: hypothetical protein KAI47_27780 [Deltaproteobacteria bacterium]|nr:hypothetical protein [Deltaproteobacteria bacterium]